MKNLSYEALYITILHFIPKKKKKIIYGLPKDKFLASPLHDEHIYIYIYLYNPLSIPWNLDKYENTKLNFFQVYNYEFHKAQLIFFFYTTDKVDLLLLNTFTPEWNLVISWYGVIIYYLIVRE